MNSRRVRKKLGEYIKTLPEDIWDLVEAFPPLSDVRAAEGVRLRIPAPGIDGSVVSYVEDRTIGVVAPVQHAYQTAAGGIIPIGTEIKAFLKPEELVYQRPGGLYQFTKRDIQTAIALLRA